MLSECLYSFILFYSYYCITTGHSLAARTEQTHRLLLSSDKLKPRCQGAGLCPGGSGVDVLPTPFSFRQNHCCGHMGLSFHPCRLLAEGALASRGHIKAATMNASSSGFAPPTPSLSPPEETAFKGLVGLSWTLSDTFPILRSTD